MFGILLDYVPHAAFRFFCQSAYIYHGRNLEVERAESVFMDADRYQLLNDTTTRTAITLFKSACIILCH
jgi:hypothetical protein